MKDWKQNIRTWMLYVLIGLAVIGFIYFLVGIVMFADKLIQL